LAHRYNFIQLHHAGQVSFWIVTFAYQRWMNVNPSSVMSWRFLNASRSGFSNCNEEFDVTKPVFYTTT